MVYSVIFKHDDNIIIKQYTITTKDNIYNKSSNNEKFLRMFEHSSHIFAVYGLKRTGKANLGNMEKISRP